MIKVKIEHDPMRAQVNLFVFDSSRDRLAVARPMEIIFDEIQDYNSSRMAPIAQIKPMLALDHAIANEFLIALTKALIEAHYGPIAETNKPELEAVKYHLEDMRKLVFKSSKI